MTDLLATPGFRETDIRPANLLDEQARRYAADVRWLLEHRSEFVSVPCPACGASDSFEAFRKYELRYARCALCETVYVNPRPTAELLELYYERSENAAYWNSHIFPASEATRRERIFRPRAERLLEICRRQQVPTDTVLEVGSGFGTFCEEISALGAFRRVVALEPSPTHAASCRGRGIEVIESSIEQAEIRERFDVVASFEVIEHLFSPAAFISRCADIVAPGGLLVLTTPNVRGFDIMVLEALSVAVDTEHLNYFHPASLSALVTSCGFEVLEVHTPGKLDAELVRTKVLSGELDLGSRPFLRRVLVDEWDRLGGAFQDFLAASGLSSHMWLVAQSPAAIR